MTHTSFAPESRTPRVRLAFIISAIVLLPFAVHAVWDQIEASLLAREVRALQARGEAINLMAQRSALPTAEERKAARLYAAAADLAAGSARDDPDTRLRRSSALLESSLSLPTLYSRLDQLEHLYIEGEPALAVLDLASPLEFTGFGDHAPELTVNGSGLEELNSFNALRADLASARHQPDEAVRRIVESIRLQRTLPSAFYEGYATSRTFESLRLLVMTNTTPVPVLETLRQAYEQTPDRDRMAADLRNARARLIGDFWPYAPNLTPWALRLKPPRQSGVVADLGFVALRPWITHRFRTMLPPMDEAIAVANGPWPAKLDAADALARRYGIDPVQRSLPRASLLSRLGFFSAYIGPSNLEWGLPAAGMTLARRRVALAVLAVEHYRRDHAEALPSSLAALVPTYLTQVPVDPFSGSAIRYVPQPDSYLMYSIDIDRKDDGGALYGTYTGHTRTAYDRRARDLGLRVPLNPLPIRD